MKTANELIADLQVVTTHAQVAEIMVDWLNAYSQELEDLYQEEQGATDEPTPII